MIWLVVLIVVWIVCAVFNCGVVFTHRKRTQPGHKKDTILKIMLAMFFFAAIGPIGTIIILSGPDRLKYGWRL